MLRGYTVPLIVGVAGAVLTLLLYAGVRASEHDRIEAEFQRRTENLAGMLAHTIDGHVGFLRSYGNQSAVFARRLQTAEPNDFLRGRQEWDESKPYIAQMISDAREQYPGIAAVGWISRLTRDQVEEYEAIARLLVDPGYHLREIGPDRTESTLGDRAEYYPVFYSEPEDSREVLLGLDLGASNKTRTTLESAAARDAVTSSEPIRYIREVTGQLGMLFAVPVYQHGQRPKSTEDRIDLVTTYLFAFVLVDDLLEAALGTVDDPGIAFFVFPGVEDTSVRSLTAAPAYASNGDIESIEAFRGDSALARYAWEGSVDVAGRVWEVVSYPTHEFIAAYSTALPEFVLAAGILLSLLTAGYLVVFIGRAERVTQLVAEKTRDLELANRALRTEMDMRRAGDTERRALESQLFQAQRMDSIGNLAGGIAHDFNNILLAVLGYIELSRNLDGLPEKAAKYLESAHNAGDRAVTLTRQLLAFGRRQPLSVAPRDVNDVITGFDDMFNRIVPENIELSIETDTEPCVVMGDGSQLEQILLNLVVNACESMPGGGRLQVRSARVHLEDGIINRHPGAEPGDYIEMSVSDTGMGIEAERLDRIFEPFYSTKENRRGSGLGLAVVYGLVDQHGGFIDVTSEPGKGTTFRIFIPRSDAAVKRRSAASKPSSEGGSETILVVEDEAEVRDFARMILEAEGYRVLLAENGKEGLDVFLKYKDEIGLVFADVVMPEMGGRSLREAIRGSSRAVPVLLTSGYLGGSDEEYFLGEDVDFIAKPYSPGTLRAEIRRVIDRKGEPDNRRRGA